jgi:hypothetical protein
LGGQRIQELRIVWRKGEVGDAFLSQDGPGVFAVAVHPNDFAFLVRIAARRIDQSSLGGNRKIGVPVITRPSNFVGSREGISGGLEICRIERLGHQGGLPAEKDEAGGVRARQRNEADIGEVRQDSNGWIPGKRTDVDGLASVRFRLDRVKEAIRIWKKLRISDSSRMGS